MKENALVDQWIHLLESEVIVYTLWIMSLVRGRVTPYSKPVRSVTLRCAFYIDF